MLRELKTALVLLILMTVLTGGVYPLFVTGFAKTFFPYQAEGGLIVRNGKIVGSELIGRPCDDPGCFRGRPSATSPFPYNAAASSGSNLGPTNPALVQAVQERDKRLKESDPGNTLPIPIDLVTASASGLDPEITPAAALWQVPRVARARGLAEARVRTLVEEHVRGRTFGVLGEPRVNVLMLNLALDEEK